MEAVLDAGAEEVNDYGETFEILSEATDLVPVRTALQDGRHRVRLGRRRLPPVDADRGRRRGRPQDPAPHRRARGPRRRPGRLRQLRRLRRGHGRARGRLTPTRARPAHLHGPTAPAWESGAVRVMGVDPGLTRCGLGVVDAAAGAQGGARRRWGSRGPSPPTTSTCACWRSRRRSSAGSTGTRPDVVAVERVLRRSDNVSTVIGTAQVAGVAMLAAARRKIPVALHTPSEVKAAVTGSGRAEKVQVQRMVAQILGLAELPEAGRRRRRPRAGDLPPLASGRGAVLAAAAGAVHDRRPSGRGPRPSTRRVDPPAADRPCYRGRRSYRCSLRGSVPGRVDGGGRRR